MNNKILIIAEGKFDETVLTKIFKNNEDIEIVSANGFSSALSMSRAFFQRSTAPFIVVLDTDTNDSLEIAKKMDFVKSYLGVSYSNSIARVVWAQPEFEIIFTEDKPLLEKLIGKNITVDEFQMAATSPKKFIEKHSANPAAKILEVLNDANVILKLRETNLIKDILEFTNIKRGQTFILKNTDRKKEFKLNKSEDFLAITKSVIPTLFGKKPNEWSSELMNSELCLNVKITKPNKSVVTYAPRLFHIMVSPYHAQPVFEDYLLYPSWSETADDSVLEIEVTSKDPEYKFEIQFVFDTSIGAVEK